MQITELTDIGFEPGEGIPPNDPNEPVAAPLGDAPGPVPFVVQFPGHLAGAPIPELHDEIHYKGYQDAINNPENPWAPFKSRIDWEVARWAKMRGPGSTAFSDLLGIEGVSCFKLAA